MKHIGLLFGSYNPVHMGHMVLANYFAEFSDMDQVWMVVSPHNPLKKQSSLLADHHRFQLVELAIGEEYKNIKTSKIEFGLPVPSYTINTLAHLSEKYPDHTFSLIMGSDNLEHFHKWKNYEQIIENHFLYVYPRPGHAGGDLKDHSNVKWTEAPLMQISSTFIRKAIKNKKDVRYYLPTAAYEYIEEM
ncbi:MAG: nicotinate-nucleotide adenylyltransferase, partial [Bacteroidia bacterium]|nr:nicotinate-nucleotide adenylyltransferase [Bacteroidia bacterium]